MTKRKSAGLSCSQAADLLGVSLGTIRRWSDVGELEPYRTPSGQTRFAPEQIKRVAAALAPGAGAATR